MGSLSPNIIRRIIYKVYCKLEVIFSGLFPITAHSIPISVFQNSMLYFEYFYTMTFLIIKDFFYCNYCDIKIRKGFTGPKFLDWQFYACTCFLEIFS